MHRRLTLLLVLSIVPMAHAAPRSDPRKVELDHLLTALKTAPTEQAAGILEAHIRDLWQQQGSPAALLLIGRGDRDLGTDPNEALDDFDAAVALEPDFADAYLRRATARFELGDYRASVDDIEQALKREPRYFPAFETLSHIAEAQNDWKGALAAWQRALEISPHTPGGAERLQLLQRKAFGQET